MDGGEIKSFRPRLQEDVQRQGWRNGNVKGVKSLEQCESAALCPVTTRACDRFTFTTQQPHSYYSCQCPLSAPALMDLDLSLPPTKRSPFFFRLFKYGHIKNTNVHKHPTLVFKDKEQKLLAMYQMLTLHGYQN